MVEEIEFKAGTSEKTQKELIDNFKKDILAKKLGITKKQLNDQINEIKSYFELNKRKIIRGFNK